MARKIIDIGAVGNDGTGDSIRDSFRKVNDNFRELYSSLGLGERLTFINLDDTPASYVGQNDSVTNATPVVTVNNTESGLTFKQLRPGNGISLDFSSNPNEITINAEFAAISADPAPQLGGNLSLRSGGNQYRVLDLPPTDFGALGDVTKNPRFPDEAVSKAYADSKISLQGVNALDPETGNVNSAFGRMGGPLILSRDPEPDDDEVYGGLIAATKRYVDNAAFGSVANLYVALSGQDDRPGVSKALQGRALAYAYKTLEAALKRAEEIILEAPQDIGPYRKTLTYGNGAFECTLTSITPAPASGTGFQGVLSMSVDTVELDLANPGTNYYPGDILELQGGTISVGGGRCTIEVLSTSSTPGQILTFRIVSSGAYSALPGSDNVPVAIITPSSIGAGPIGFGARFDVTYRVNSVRIKTIAEDGVDGRGTGYGLVSVRISGGGGTGAFGTAVVGGGQIQSITITDKGSGFTTLPTLEVNLPRFSIFTAGQRTDFTGNVSTSTPEAIRSRDIREGLFLKGNTSGALAQILNHNGSLDSGGNELFDVDIKYGNFQIGETISYGDVSKDVQITILVESGEYYENYPLKVPQNVSIVGDEFRRVIIRPKNGTSSSPWAFQKFRRDRVIDGLSVADREYGYHYLQDSSRPVYVKPLTGLPIDNKGDYKSAAALLEVNRSFIQEEIIAWMNYNIVNNIAPFGISFDYNQALCKRDAGQLVDAFVFDLKYGGQNRTISAGLKYYESQSALIAITTQLTQYLAVLTQMNLLMQAIISNTAYTPRRQSSVNQVIDPAFQAESGSGSVLADLVDALKDVIDGSGSVNYPKENNQMDVFLANDAVRWQAITCQGHGGFMCVLDPAGQILAKSPYAQECASFSRSIDAQTFAGGMFADGFAGNLQFTIDVVDTPTRLEVSKLDRFPQLPCSFIVADSVYRVNYVRDFVYSPGGSTATFILDEATPWPYDVFQYDSAACYRDVGLIIDGLGYDIVFGTNYNTRLSGLTYRLSNAELVIQEQRQITIDAIELAHDLAKATIPAYTSVQDIVDLSSSTIVDIIERGVSGAPTLTFTLPPGLSADLTNAYTLLLANRNYIVAEVQGWIDAQIAGNISPWATGDTYNVSKSQRDTLYVIEAVIYDLIYGGNTATRRAALKYYNNLTGASLLATGQPARCSAAITYASTIAQRIIQNLAPVVTYSTLSRVTGTPATATEATRIATLMSAVSNAISVNNFATAQSSIVEVLPDISAYAYNTISVLARTSIASTKTSIQTQVVEFVDETGNQYELLMPGNRSMLANDFTQINDMGYGAVAMNGGLLELVSMFTYYCYISYYSVTGGQIRSVGGSSAHGVYALVAEGADPLEVPTPTTLFEELSQRVDCYFPSPSYANVIGGLFIFVNNFDYPPTSGSELEIDHGNVIYRYPVVSATTVDLPAGVARLNLSTGTGAAESEGLFAAVPDGTKMTLRSNGQIILTGNLVNVAVRPSTGLKLRETSETVYRVLQFAAYTDPNGPYEISISNGTPVIIRLLETVTTIDTDVCTTSRNHKLKIGDQFIPTSTANGFIAGNIYYIKTVPSYNQFTVTLSPGGSTVTLTNGTGLSIKGARTHRMLENYTLIFSTTGSLPNPLLPGEIYYVASTALTETEFSVTTTRFGNPLNTTSAGSGTHTFNMYGLTRTNLRENYNYVELTTWQPGEYVTSGSVCTISIGSPATITLASHGFVAGDVIKFTTDGSLPSGISPANNYFVLSDSLALNTFRVSLFPEGTPADTSGTQSGTQRVGKVTGRAGDSTFAVVPVATQEISRVAGAKFVFKGEEYIVSTYEPETVTNEPYARVTLNRPLVDSIIQYGASYTAKAGVAIRSTGSLGTLTIRISLTRVTSHDLLEIGTGSYADTNYPKEIYGQSVNPPNEDLETEERDVGRCFYVTTDQFGNFRVGPYFKVDQGTGTVTFSSSIALSNLDGIGFKRGVPVSEFSTDSGFTDNATDTVPTENATRIYIERRLGISHDGLTVVEPAQLLPVNTGGYMPLTPIAGVAMKANMPLGGFKIVDLGNPTAAQDAVNLRSLTWNNFQDFTATNLDSADILVFTGAGNSSVNATVVGDITFDLRPGVDSTINQIDAQINPGVIINADVNASAAIAQSKLAMNAATTRANATGITQADRGLASFDSAVFDVTDGWVTVKGNGLVLGDLPQIASNTVLANSTLGTANVSAVAFSTVVDTGGSIKKTQYSTTGFLRRTSSASFTSDADYIMVEAAAGSAATPEASKIVIRDSNGDFGARNVDVSQLKVDNNVAIDGTTTATGGVLRYYGWNGGGGVLVSNGSLAADKVTYYDNDSHQFRTQNGLSNAPIIASQIQVTAITTGGNTTAGTITGRWTLTGTSPNESRLQATYSADLAEYYEGDKEYEVGTVLVFGGDKEVTITNIKGDTRVAGVVSNTAAFAMYEGCPGLKNLVALQGRVPCKVVGKIRKGDILITAGIAGVAVAAEGDVKVGTVVGKALENYDSDHIGTIEIAVGRT